jgi:hypothetical protein
MKLKILQSTQIATPSTVWNNNIPIFKLIIKEIVKYVVVYV